VGKALIAAQRWVALQLAHLQEFDKSGGSELGDLPVEKRLILRDH
jgi:hypothetical protein